MAPSISSRNFPVPSQTFHLQYTLKSNLQFDKSEKPQSPNYDLAIQDGSSALKHK